ncbi:hypothetical protein ACHAO8_000002 [Botrytis cinerea]
MSQLIGIYGVSAVSSRLMDQFSTQDYHVYFTARSNHSGKVRKIQRGGLFTVKRHCSRNRRKWEEDVEQRVANFDNLSFVEINGVPNIMATTTLRNLVEHTRKIYVSIILKGDQSENSHEDVINHFLQLNMDLSHLVLTIVKAHAFSILAEQMGLLKRVRMITDLTAAPYATRNESDVSSVHNIMNGRKIWLVESHTTSTSRIDKNVRFMEQECQLTMSMLKIEVMILYNAIDAFFNYMNPVFHIPIAYANMSRIDSGHPLTESVKLQIRAFDADRRAVLVELNYLSARLNAMDHGHKMYSLSFTEEDEFGKRTPVHNKTSGIPTSMQNYRYTIEDGRWYIRAATFAKAIRVKVRTIKGHAQQTINLLGEKKTSRATIRS